MIFILFDSNSFIDQPNDGTVNHCLPKLFDQIQDKARFTWSIRMEKPSITIESRQNEGLRHLRIENAGPVIETRAEAIHSPTSFTSSPRPCTHANIAES